MKTSSGCRSSSLHVCYLHCCALNHNFYQGSKEIRQWPINKCTSLMMIHKITPFCRLKLVDEKYEHSNYWINQSKFTKVPKIVRPTLRKSNYKTLGTGVINSPSYPLSLTFNSQVFLQFSLNVRPHTIWVKH